MTSSAEPATPLALSCSPRLQTFVSTLVSTRSIPFLEQNKARPSSRPNPHGRRLADRPSTLGRRQSQGRDVTDVWPGVGSELTVLLLRRLAHPSPNSRQLLTAANNIFSSQPIMEVRNLTLGFLPLLTSRSSSTVLPLAFSFTHPKVPEKTCQTCLPAHLSHLHHALCLSPFPLSVSQRSLHRYIALRPPLTIDSRSCSRQ